MSQYIRYPASGGGGSGTVNAIGIIDSQPKSANGGVIDGSDLIFQTADVTFPGLVSTGTQSFAGNKTFTGTISASNLSGTNTGDVTLNAVGAVPNGNGASLTGQALTLQPANATFPGVLLAADWVRFDDAASRVTSGTPYTFAGFDVSGDLYTQPDWNINPITGGAYVPLNLTPADITGTHVINDFVNNITPTADLLNTSFQGMQNYNYLVGGFTFTSFIGFNNGINANGGGAKGSILGINNSVDLGNSGDPSTSAGVTGFNQSVSVRDDHTALNYVAASAFNMNVDTGGALDGGGGLITGNFILDGTSDNGFQLLSLSSTLNGNFTTGGINGLVLTNNINSSLQYANGVTNNTNYGATAVINGQLGFQDNTTAVSGASLGYVQSFQSNVVLPSGVTTTGIAAYSNTSQYNQASATFGFTGYQHTPQVSDDMAYGQGFQDNMSFESGANIIGDYNSASLSPQFKVGSTVRSYTALNINPTFSAPITDDTRGIGVFYNNTTAGDGITGMDIGISNATCSGGNINGVNINITNSTGNEPQGVIGIQSNARISVNAETELTSGLGFQIGNRIQSLFSVPSGSPVTGTDSIGNNFAGDLSAQDDVAAGGFGIGWNSVGFIASVAVANTKTVDKMTVFLPGMSLVDPGYTTGGHVNELNIVSTFSPLPSGGTLTIDDAYVFKLDPVFGNLGSLATNAWGVWIADTTVDNWFAKDVVIGGTTGKPIGSEKLTVNGSIASVGSTSGTFNQSAADTTTSYSVKWPAAQGAASTVLSNDGSGNLSWSSALTPTAPTVQKFLTGSGTYTTPSGVLYLVVKMVGAGAGGSGSDDNNTSAGDGTDGTDTTFGTAFLVAGGGQAGTHNNNPPLGGVGGIGDLDTADGMVFDGEDGGDGAQVVSTSSAIPIGGKGGASVFGGAGAAVGNARAGKNAKANTGSGGSGGGCFNSAGSQGGTGGGAGAYVEAILQSPSATYSYSVGVKGTGGAAGSNGYAGGDGADGMIIVEEYYQ